MTKTNAKFELDAAIALEMGSDLTPFLETFHGEEGMILAEEEADLPPRISEWKACDLCEVVAAAHPEFFDYIGENADGTQALAVKGSPPVSLMLHILEARGIKMEKAQ